MHDEELRTCRVGQIGSGHGEHTGSVSEIILKAVAVEFSLNGVAGATHSGAVGATALNHKSADNAVKDESVIIALFDETDEIIDGIRRSIGIKLRFDYAAVFHFDSNYGILSHN